MSRVTEDQKQQIFDLRQKRWGVGQIALRLGMPRGTVAYWVLSMGAAGRDGASPKLPSQPVKRGAHTVRRFTPAEDAELIRLARTMRVAEVARQLGRPPNSVKGRLMTLAYQAEREGGHG